MSHNLGVMTDKNFTYNEELDSLERELISACRENYISLSKVMKSLINLSRRINSEMETLCQSIKELEEEFVELLSGEEDLIIKKALKPQERREILDSLTFLISQVSNVGLNYKSISKEFDKIFHNSDESDV